MRNVGLITGEKVVDAENFVAVFEQPVAQARAKETRPAGHEDSLGAAVKSRHLPLLNLCCDSDNQG